MSVQGSCACVCVPVLYPFRNKCVTMKVCVPGMECVCARWCANVHLGCSVCD